MRLIKPYTEILNKVDGMERLKFLELCGRVCYKSEDLITDDSAKSLITAIVKRGHESVLEHVSMSVRFVCDRGVSHELVRHRLCAFSQESTRYCDYSKDKFNKEITFIIPPWVDVKEGVYKLNGTTPFSLESDWGANNCWFHSLLVSEIRYFSMLKEWSPQQARSVLPNSLKTEIIVTANLREWKHIFRLRTAKEAHPQMAELMRPLLDEFKTIFPIIYDEINY